MDVYRTEQGNTSRIGVLQMASGHVSFLPGQELAKRLGCLDQGSPGGESDRLLILNESGLVRVPTLAGDRQHSGGNHLTPVAGRQCGWALGD